MHDSPRGGGEIASHRIQSLLGQGGMGIVYLAERPQGGLCALKVLSRRPGHDPSFATRFKREAGYVASLDHPHIPQLYETGETPDGTLYFAMQYVPGANLAYVLARDGPLDFATALVIVGQIGDALDFAHASGLVHRDVKPANILVTDGDGGSPYAYLTDFGLGKNPNQDSIALTQKGNFVGTCAYAAPEQILGQPSNHLVDIYSLGCVLYEALVGAPPFVRAHELDVMYAHLGESRPSASAQRPDLPAELDAVIAKAMSISADSRYASCGEFIEAARELLVVEDEPLAVTAGSIPSQSMLSGTPDETPAQEASAESDTVRTQPEPLNLVVTSGPAKGRELTVDEELELGRVTTLDGALGDPEISRRHAVIRREATGGYVVEDQGSANGTFVNGVAINGVHPLRPGDQLRLGSTSFDVRTSSARPTNRVGVHLELDVEAGELLVTFDDGPRTRIVRDDRGWRAETA